MNYSIFGPGFIGSQFCKQFASTSVIHKIPRDFYFPVDGTEQIVYFISTTHNYNVFTNPHLDIDTNLNVLISVLENCKDKDLTFNFISSWFVFGNCDELPATEETVCKPTGFYSITKKCAEDLLISYCNTFNIKYRIIRMGNVYGKSDKFSKQKNALQYLIERLKRDEDIELYFGGDFIRDYMNVYDVCRAIKTITEMGSDNISINVGCGMPLRFRDLIDIAYKTLNSKSKIISVEQPAFHKIVQVKDMWLNSDKLKALGFKQEIDIETGIRELCK